MIRVRRAKVHRSVGLTEPSPTETRKLVRYPANFLGLGEALIFFCFFSSIKGRKEGRERPRNSGLQPIAKKKHAQIPDYGPISKKKHRRIPDYRPIASRRQALFAPDGIHSQARDTEKRLPISYTRPIRSLYSLLSTLYPLLSTLYSLLSTLYPLLSTLYSLPSTLYPLHPLLTDPYSRTTAEAAPQPNPRSNTPSVRRGRYGWIARSDAPPPRSPADSRRTG